MPQLKSFFARGHAVAVGAAYAGTVIFFLWVCSLFSLPGKGFTYLIEFGELQAPRYLPELRAFNHFELPKSYGYDAQWYAQIAMRPRLSDPVLKAAIDNLPYRARRILLCWSAYALAGGDPIRALHLFAVQNIACWVLLAVLLLRWFPPRSWGNWLRWAAVLFSFGLCVSVRGSLMDGPGLLFIAAGMALLESGRPWLAAVVLGISGLVKETNLLAAAALAPSQNTSRAWGRSLGRWLIVALPLGVWLVVLWRWLGDPSNAGLRNFAAPFAGYVGKWAEIRGLMTTEPDWLIRGDVVLLASLTVQWLFLALRPRWRDPWWRIGAAYAALMIVLGPAVWESYPGAAARVLLPMTLAFNILVPRGRRWWIVLLAGNLSVVATPDALPIPGRESYVAKGPAVLRTVPETGRVVEAIFDDRWYPPEKSLLEFWRWSRGNGSVTFRNPHPYAVIADISFWLKPADVRTVGIRQGAREPWVGLLKPNESRAVTVPNVRLEPGDTVWEFVSDKPALIVGTGDGVRALGFSLRNLEIDLKAKADERPGR